MFTNSVACVQHGLAKLKFFSQSFEKLTIKLGITFLNSELRFCTLDSCWFIFICCNINNEAMPTILTSLTLTDC